MAEFGFSDVLINFIYDIRLPQGFTPESIVFKIRLLGNFFVVDRCMYSGNKSHFNFCGRTRGKGTKKQGGGG